MDRDFDAFEGGLWLALSRLERDSPGGAENEYSSESEHCSHKVSTAEK